MTDRIPPIPPEEWGKDHLSLLLYLETRLVDHDGRLGIQHMRGHREGDSARYPTLLADGHKIYNHSDFDCLRDLIVAEYVTAPNPPSGRYTFRYPNGDVKELGFKVDGLTDTGWAKVQELRQARVG